MSMTTIDFEVSNGQLPNTAPDLEKLKSTITTMIKLGKLLAKTTPSTYDNQVVDFLEPIVTSQEFVEVLVWAMEKFKDNPKQLNVLLGVIKNDE